MLSNYNFKILQIYYRFRLQFRIPRKAKQTKDDNTNINPRYNDIIYLKNLIKQKCKDDECYTILISGNTGCGKTYTVQQVNTILSESKRYQFNYFLSYSLQDKLTKIKQHSKKYQIVIIDEIDALYLNIGVRKTQKVIDYYRSQCQVLILITNKFKLNLKNINEQLQFANYNQQQLEKIAIQLNVNADNKLTEDQLKFLTNKIKNNNQDVRKLIKCVDALSEEKDINMKDVLQTVVQTKNKLTLNEAAILNLLECNQGVLNISEIKNNLSDVYHIQLVNIDKQLNNLKNYFLIKEEGRKIILQKDEFQNYKADVQKIVSELL